MRALPFALAFALAACATSGGPPPPSSPSPLLDAALPDFDRRTLDGGRIDTAQLRGRVVVVEFFATYCAPCRDTLPAVQRLHTRLGREVAFVGVNIDEYESKAREMATAFGLSFPVVHDAGGVRGRFRVTDLPATFVADPDGVVRWVRVGGSGSTGDELERAIAAARGE
jgi:thiol-disulfide isomerase/thioredoxin